MSDGRTSGVAARVAAVASAFPPHVVDREEAAAALERLFPDHPPDFVRSLVERSGVERRAIVPNLDELLVPASFTARNERYREAAAELSERACRVALDRARLRPNEVDAIVDVSCTGIAIPALDVALAARLGLRPDAWRIPITESGCAAGALALGLAGSLAAGGRRVLVVAVELCTLTLVRDDRSRANLVASVLFGDGAAAAIVVPEGRGPRILAAGSHLIPGTHDVMGFEVGDHGLRIRLQPELPQVLVEHVPAAQRAFLAAHGRTPADVGLHLLHPGGRRILDAYARMHGLEERDLRFSRESLRAHGNLSSASILNVLELALAEGHGLREDQVALALAIGPGLSLEMVLFSWNS